MSDEQVEQTLRDYAAQIHEHLVVRIIPTEAMNHAHEGIVVGHVDSHGNIQLPADIRQTSLIKTATDWPSTWKWAMLTNMASLIRLLLP